MGLWINNDRVGLCLASWLRSLVCWVTHTQPMTYPLKWQGQACWHSPPLQGWGRKDLAEEHLPGVYEVLGLVPSTTDLKLGGRGLQSQRGLYFQLTRVHHTPALQPVSCLFLWTLPLSDHIFYFMALQGKEVLFSLGVLSLSVLICFKAGSHHIARLGLRFLALKQLFNPPFPSEVGTMEKHSVLKIC